MPDEKKEQTLAEDTVDALEAVGKVTLKGAGKILKGSFKVINVTGKGAIKGAQKVNKKIKEKKTQKKSEEQE